MMPVPEWVAPVGKVRDDLKLGDRVRFEAVLMDSAGGNHWKEGVEAPDDWVGWSRHPNHFGQGIIAGLRFVYSGRIMEESYGHGGGIMDLDPAEGYRVRSRLRTHRVYLVCLNIHHKPVHVLSDDVVLLES